MINFTFLLRYDETKDVTTGMVRLVMSERAAFEAHMYVQELKTWLPLVNDWIRTGHAYVNRIFRWEKWNLVSSSTRHRARQNFGPRFICFFCITVRFGRTLFTLTGSPFFVCDFHGIHCVHF